MIRFLRFFSEARNKPPLHAMKDGLFAFSTVPSSNHWQVRPRRHVIRWTIPESQVNQKQEQKWIWGNRAWIAELGFCSTGPSGDSEKEGYWGYMLGRCYLVWEYSELFHTCFSLFFSGGRREVKRGRAGSSSAVRFSFGDRWMGIDIGILSCHPR